MDKPKERGLAYRVREAKAADTGGLLETLVSLSDVEGLTTAEAKRIFAGMKRSPVYHLLVAVTPSGKVIGAITLLVEQKFIHKGGLVGHIEDVAVGKGYEGNGIGRSLVAAAIKKAERFGCYKVILDCKEDVVGFYEKLGFRRHEVGMRIDLRRVRR